MKPVWAESVWGTGCCHRVQGVVINVGCMLAAEIMKRGPVVHTI